MFTGLVQSIGEIRAVQHLGREKRFSIAPKPSFKKLQTGESIAVNGACLSVESWGADWFQVYASAETLNCTNLGQLQNKSRVNLERALAVGERLGGHMVNAHVDCLAKVEQVQPAGSSWSFTFSFPQEWSRYVAPKGSISLDGISLTVNDCETCFLQVNIIPATQQETTVLYWKPGRAVNMEVDIIAKYVQNMLFPWAAEKSSSARKGDIDLDFLAKHGF